jgi:hypothetical protein
MVNIIYWNTGATSAIEWTIYIVIVVISHLVILQAVASQSFDIMLSAMCLIMQEMFWLHNVCYLVSFVLVEDFNCGVYWSSIKDKRSVYAELFQPNSPYMGHALSSLNLQTTHIGAIDNVSSMETTFTFLSHTDKDLYAVGPQKVRVTLWSQYGPHLSP